MGVIIGLKIVQDILNLFRCKQNNNNVRAHRNSECISIICESYYKDGNDEANSMISFRTLITKYIIQLDYII